MNRYQNRLKLPLKKQIMICFMGSFFVGIIIANILGNEYFNRIGVISSYFIEKYKYNDINSFQLFNYILEKRMVVILLLWVMGFTMISKVINCGYILWTGFSMGIAISCLVMKFGIKGLLVFSAAVFPHFILYIIALVILLIKSENIYQRGMEREKRSGIIFEYGVVLLICIFLIFFGVGVESFINPMILHSVLS